MADRDRRVAENVFASKRKHERKISEAVKLEHGRHAAAVKNMQRLRVLRLSREQAKSSH
jgi:hypothetical protein